MRIPAILTCLLAVFLVSVPVRRAQAEEVSFDVFYNNLADDGDWYNTPEYGYVWQPSIAYKNDKWRPYTDGYWAQTDDGWTWVSYENFGWATYHYGRWTRLKDVGWAWVPGYDWGPGWVSWRTSDDYVGWAPLPPKVERGVYEGGVVDQAPAEAIDYNDVEPADYGPDVDVQYDIGPQNYCFVDTHNFGAPVLGEVCLPPERNFIIIENTINVTNIYRRRGPDQFVVFNRGPDYNFVSAHSERPIQQLRIDRHDDISYLQNGIHGGGNANQVRNGVFAVAAPMITRAPINFAQVKPAKVKETIARPEVIHGWSHAGGDPAAIQRLHEKFQQQAQAAPAPRRETGPLPPRPPVTAVNPPPTRGDAAQPFNQPNTGSHQPLTDADKAARRDAAQRARDERQKAQSTGQPPVSVPARGPAANAPVPNGQNLTPEESKAARQAQKKQDRASQPPAGAQPFANPGQPSAANPPVANAPAPDADKAARQARKQQEKAQQTQQAAQAQQQQQAAQAQQQARQAQQQQERQAQQDAADRDARRTQRPQEQSAAPRAPQPQSQPEAANPDRDARRAQREQEQAPPRAPQPQAQQPEAANPDRDARRAQRQQEQTAAPRAPQPQAEAPRHQPENAPQATPPVKGDDGKKRKDPPQ